MLRTRMAIVPHPHRFHKLLTQFKPKTGELGDRLPCLVSEKRTMRSSLFLALQLALFHSISARSATPPGPDSFGYSVAMTTTFSFTNISDGTRTLFFTH